MPSNHQDGGVFSFDDNSPAGAVPVTPSPTAQERGVSPDSSYATARGLDDDPPLPKIVKLDVGGFVFTTSRATLCRVAGSYFQAMFSGRHSMEELQSEDGSYFIDRDGRCVQAIAILNN